MYPQAFKVWVALWQSVYNCVITASRVCIYWTCIYAPVHSNPPSQTQAKSKTWAFIQRFKVRSHRTPGPIICPHLSPPTRKIENCKGWQVDHASSLAKPLQETPTACKEIAWSGCWWRKFHPRPYVPGLYYWSSNIGFVPVKVPVLQRLGRGLTLTVALTNTICHSLKCLREKRAITGIHYPYSPWYVRACVMSNTLYPYR